EPINRVADALQKSRIGNDIPHKELVVRNIRTVTLKPVSLVNKDGGYKITTELTPQR
ncbi:phage tail protein, partial [Salmonella enterica subsp. diarizonae]|nr:phage tail protein [Salmonella enterica subsp. diarizonae str. CFSAN000553]ELU5499150.1 phage tail protein [Salmonella enterica]MLU19818.1 phage tail protein [Salmonella enterica subsp. diarizonae]